MSHFMVHGVNIMVNWNGVNIVMNDWNSMDIMMNLSVMWG